MIQCVQLVLKIAMCVNWKHVDDEFILTNTIMDVICAEEEQQQKKILNFSSEQITKFRTDVELGIPLACIRSSG